MWVELAQPEGTTSANGYWRLEDLSNLSVPAAAQEDGNYYIQGISPDSNAGHSIYLAPPFATQADAETALAAFLAQFVTVVQSAAVAPS